MRTVTRASIRLIRAVEKKGRTVRVARPGSDELRYLDHMQANANVGGIHLTDILLREDARKVEVLEEFLHGTQARIGIIEILGVPEAERHVKEFMLRHQKLLGISSRDAKILRRILGEKHE